MSSVQYSIPYDMLPLLSNPSTFQTTAFKPISHKKTAATFITKVFHNATSSARRTVFTAHHKKYDLLEDDAFETFPTSPVFPTGSSSGYSSASTHGFKLKSRRQRSDTLMSATSVDSVVSDSGSSRRFGARSTSSSRSSSPERKHTVIGISTRLFPNLGTWAHSINFHILFITVSRLMLLSTDLYIRSPNGLQHLRLLSTSCYTD
ncbi:hypothetical protein CC80DRAFT_532997 [Byssothecium circinans]|uniref:Uncharacterized protein n=1 Tax=Byssothecium circinans TaxID=147558 RepID=A0A6A5UES6_9PLEO|nr:hypothetical protein CC80DRAFT_532997 [Byssothecium circinans]